MFVANRHECPLCRKYVSIQSLRLPQDDDELVAASASSSSSIVVFETKIQILVSTCQFSLPLFCSWADNIMFIPLQREELAAICASHPQAKALVFSQFDETLKLTQAMMKRVSQNLVKTT